MGTRWAACWLPRVRPPLAGDAAVRFPLVVGVPGVSRLLGSLSGGCLPLRALLLRVLVWPSLLASSFSGCAQVPSTPPSRGFITAPATPVGMTLSCVSIRPGIRAFVGTALFPLDGLSL